MKNNPTVLILCGGKGERLWPITKATPKPLVLIKCRPILSYLMEHLQKFALKNIVIAAGFQADKIHGYFQDNHCDLNATIVDSGDVDIIDRIKMCASHIKGDFIVLYGDTLADVNLEKLQEFHFSHNLQATITLWPFKSSFGLAELDQDGNVINFMEKPTLNQWINIGHFYYEKEVLRWMNDFTNYAEFLEFLAVQKKLKGFKHRGIHITVNTLRELEDAEQNINHFAAKL